MTTTRVFYFVGFMLVAFGALASYALAQGAPTREAIQERMEERQEEVAERIEERRADVASGTEAFREEFQAHRAALAEKLQDRIYNLASNITRRMQAAVERLQHIADRMETRATKLKEDGADTAAAESAIEEARGYLATAAGILDDDLGAFVGSDNPREAWKTTRTQFAEAREAILAARESLHTALAALKEAAAGAEIGAGVSPAVTNATSTGASEETTETSE